LSPFEPAPREGGRLSMLGKKRLNMLSISPNGSQRTMLISSLLWQSCVLVCLHD
jgi:hypothetical protein